MDLPDFKYHPDPIATGSIIPSVEVCPVCGERRGFAYDGIPYAKNELKHICPWCIADGSAHEKFAAEFTDTEGVGGYSRWEKAPKEVVEEVAFRTPGFAGWQQEQWYTHCGDAAEFLGPMGKEELERFGPEAIAVVREESGRQGDDWKYYFSKFRPCVHSHGVSLPLPPLWTTGWLFRQPLNSGLPVSKVPCAQNQLGRFARESSDDWQQPLFQRSCVKISATRAAQTGEQLMKLWGKVVAAFSPRKDYQDALAAIESALNSGELKHTDNASLAFAIVEDRQPSRMARLVDGVDTVELHAFAEEKGMRVVTAGDVVSLLKAVMAKG